MNEQEQLLSEVIDSLNILQVENIDHIRKFRNVVSKMKPGYQAVVENLFQAVIEDRPNLKPFYDILVEIMSEVRSGNGMSGGGLTDIIHNMLYVWDHNNADNLVRFDQDLGTISFEELLELRDMVNEGLAEGNAWLNNYHTILEADYLSKIGKERLGKGMKGGVLNNDMIDYINYAIESGHNNLSQVEKEHLSKILSKASLPQIRFFRFVTQTHESDIARIIKDEFYKRKIETPDSMVSISGLRLFGNNRKNKDQEGNGIEEELENITKKMINEWMPDNNIVEFEKNIKKLNKKSLKKLLSQMEEALNIQPNEQLYYFIPSVRMEIESRDKEYKALPNLRQFGKPPKGGMLPVRTNDFIQQVLESYTPNQRQRYNTLINAGISPNQAIITIAQQDENLGESESDESDKENMNGDGISGGIYCTKCRRKTKTTNKYEKLAKNNRKMKCGQCAVCGTNKSKFMKGGMIPRPPGTPLKKYGPPPPAPKKNAPPKGPPKMAPKNLFGGGKSNSKKATRPVKKYFA